MFLILEAGLFFEEKAVNLGDQFEQPLGVLFFGCLFAEFSPMFWVVHATLFPRSLDWAAFIRSRERSMESKRLRKCRVDECLNVWGVPRSVGIFSSDKAPHR